MTQFKDLRSPYQWIITISFVIILTFVLGWWIGMVSEQKLGVVLIFVMVPLIQFLITPLFSLTGLYKYYSPMVVSMGSNNRVIDLHNGTSFNYLMNMRGIKPGREWERKMVTYYLEALLNIIRKIEDQQLSENIIIRGSSYFISSRTARKFGFKTSKTTFVEKVNIVLNYMDLIWMYSLSKKKFIFPNLSKTVTISTSGADLLRKKDTLERVLSSLNKTEPNS